MAPDPVSSSHLRPAAQLPLPRPAQLPIACPVFVGRQRELAELAATLKSTPVLITGMVGVGKAALALHFAHQHRDEFLDGQLYANLCPNQRNASDTSAILAYFLLALGIPPDQIPTGTDQRAGLYRSVLAARKVLVVLGRACREADVRPFLAATTTSQILVTSRARLDGLDGIHRLRLEALSPEDSAAMVAAIAGPERVRAEPHAAAEVSELCDRLPLAIRGAATRLAAHPGWSMGHSATRLRDESRRLHHLDAGDIGVESRLTSACERLDQPARTMFGHLGRSSAYDTDAKQLAMAQGISLGTVETLLDTLADHGLLKIDPITGRYRLPTLFRLFARKHADGTQNWVWQDARHAVS